jgi:hypothetical protein
MISMMHQRFHYIVVLCGLALGMLLIIITNSLRHLDNHFLVIGSQFLVIVALTLAVGTLLKISTAHSYIVSFVALLYAYALSGLFMFTQTIHYGLYVFLMGVITGVIFYVSDYFFNRTRIHIAAKLTMTAAGFIVVFFASSLLGLQILRLISVN